jgi:hypothetical protein
MKAMFTTEISDCKYVRAIGNIHLHQLQTPCNYPISAWVTRMVLVVAEGISVPSLYQLNKEEGGVDVAVRLYSNQ